MSATQPAGGVAAASTGGARPNILLIQCDQLRYDCLGHTGHPLAHTPNIDRLAREGMRFERAYTPIPTCCPARQCLLSGQWPEVHGGLWNYDITLPVPLFQSPTWTEKLHAAGYRMGYVGKWHVHPEKTPLEFGFDDNITEADHATWLRAQAPDPGSVPAPEAGEPWFFGGVDPAPLEQTRTHWLAGQCIELIRRYHGEGQPWHIRLDHSEPHLPCFPVRQFLDLYDPARIEPWGNFPDPFTNKPYIQKQQLTNWGLEHTSWREWAVYVQRYLAMVSQVDDAVGLVMDELKELGLERETLVIFTTDHGDACGGHGMIDKHYTMYEDITHVPLLARWPGVISPGLRSGLFVNAALDLAATAAEVGGVEFPCQGRSLLPLMRGEAPADWRRYGFSTYNGQQFGLFCMRMIRDERWKYVWNPTDTDELYDMESDPWELTNRIGDAACAGELTRLRAALAEDLERRGDRLAGQWIGKQLTENRKLVG